MVARILAIGTAVPDATLDQDAVRDLFAGQPGVDRLTVRLIRAAFDQSAISRRHTVLPELAAGGSAFIDADSRVLANPSTGARNAVYRREAPDLFARAARAALTGAAVAPGEVTHVVTASCTGFFAPGPEYRLVRDLGLSPTVPRDHLGFLGCAAALPALRAASRICAAEPDAVVLVACAELCTIHIRLPDDPEQIVAAAVFADGAAAAIVTARPPRIAAPTLDLDGFATALTSEGEADIDWTIGDHGFRMRLSAEVPRIIGREVRAALAPLDTDGLAAWAVHPGGRSVLDRVQEAFALPDAALAPSRAILHDYGNMSSATVLFILARLLRDGTLRDGTLRDSTPRDGTLRDGDRALALAFGPGLTVEAAQLTARVPGR